MLQRNVEIPGRPELVPPQVSADEARAILAAGRPAGTAGELVVDGLRCPTITAGEGLPVVLVHGLGHDMWDWAPFFSRRPAGARFTALDLPGFGLADAPDRDYPLQLLVDAVLAACVEPSIVVGSSLGGHVAMLAALAAPAKVRGLFLLDPGGLVEAPAAVQQMARTYYGVAAIRGRAESDIVGNSRRIFSRPSDTAERLAARKLAVHRSPLRDVLSVPFARVVDDVFRHPVIGRLTDLAAPAYFVHGEADVVVPAAAVEAGARRLGAPYRPLAGVGHAPHLESADESMAFLAAFIEDVRAGGGSARTTGGPNVSR